MHQNQSNQLGTIFQDTDNLNSIRESEWREGIQRHMTEQANARRLPFPYTAQTRNGHQGNRSADIITVNSTPNSVYDTWARIQEQQANLVGIQIAAGGQLSTGTITANQIYGDSAVEYASRGARLGNQRGGNQIRASHIDLVEPFLPLKFLVFPIVSKELRTFIEDKLSSYQVKIISSISEFENHGDAIKRKNRIYFRGKHFGSPELTLTDSQISSFNNTIAFIEAKFKVREQKIEREERAAEHLLRVANRIGDIETVAELTEFITAQR